MPKTAVDKLARETIHRGVIAITGSYSYLGLEELIKGADSEENPLFVVLDQVQDPRNLGAIMRSAHAFGASGIIIPKDRAARVTAAVVRTSVGASELIKTARVTNLVRAIDRLKAEGYQVYGAAVRGNIALSNMGWRGRSVLAMGSEGRGLRRLTEEHCDQLFTIPLAVDFDSLNVSSAAAIALYEAAKQRFR
jgi:23S rRNA (guanosine2251-2'-O)-methyltransferase